MGIESVNLLCRPFGGLNDTLEQINKCLKYAISHKRTLFIDTKGSGLMGEFSSFFEFNKKFDICIETSVDSDKYSALNKMGSIPLVMSGHVDGQLNYSHSNNNWVDKINGDLVTFDFENEHNNELLIHAQCGGGYYAHSELLCHLKITNNIINKIIEVKRNLPADYIAIHIRNTDYQTDYKKFFAELKEKVKGKNIFISSDDSEVIDFGIIYFEESNVHSLNKSISLIGKPLHSRWSYRTDEERLLATHDSIRDLILLASGTEFYFTQTITGAVSGYSKMVQYLNNNKTLINSLMQI
jgi:hypothetical protein